MHKNRNGEMGKNKMIKGFTSAAFLSVVCLIVVTVMYEATGRENIAAIEVSLVTWSATLIACFVDFLTELED